MLRTVIAVAVNGWQTFVRTNAAQVKWLGFFMRVMVGENIVGR